MRKASLGTAAFALLTLTSIAFGAPAAEQKGPAACATMRAALKAMLAKKAGPLPPQLPDSTTEPRTDGEQRAA